MRGRSSGPEARGRSWGRADTRGATTPVVCARREPGHPVPSPSLVLRDRPGSGGSVPVWGGGGVLGVGAACPPGGRRPAAGPPRRKDGRRRAGARPARWERDSPPTAGSPRCGSRQLCTMVVAGVVHIFSHGPGRTWQARGERAAMPTGRSEVGPHGMRWTTAGGRSPRLPGPTSPHTMEGRPERGTGRRGCRCRSGPTTHGLP